jgi:HAMP domain-containing protein
MSFLSLLRKQKLSLQLGSLAIAVPSLLLTVLLGVAIATDGALFVRYKWTIAIGSAAVLLVYSVVVYLYIRQKLVSRLTAAQEALQNLQTGQFTQPLNTNRQDEISDMGQIINSLAAELQKATEFAQQISADNIEASFTPATEDKLGHALVKMRESLKQARMEDQRRNWATEGLSKFVEILRSQENIKDLSNQIVKNLVQSLNANQGALFLLNKTESGSDCLEMKGCYAYKRTKHLTKEVSIGQGLIGQTFLEQETVYLKQIPENFVSITSGLGEANPRNLLITPLKMNDTTVGILELASFREFQPYEIAFVEKLSENIAHTVLSFQNNEHTRRLLRESQEQAELMRSQEEELRQNQEELQATQEEISRRYQALFNQLHDLNHQSKFDQLKSINSTKKRHIEYYFDTIRKQIFTFAENKMIIQAVKDFKTAFYTLHEGVSPEQLEHMQHSLHDYYVQEFIPRLNDNTNHKAHPETYLPADKLTIVGQYNYISNNPHPTGQKSLLDDAGDGSDYSRIHAHYHPVMRSFLEKFGYYDIFLIDPETGHMLYSVFKEVDFATSLLTDLYHTTNFGTVVKEAIQSTEPGFVRLIDFEPYDPSYNAPASFIACPVYDKEEKVGILVFQMPINKINQVLTGDNHWREDGLGDSGETFIVGKDYKLRSVVRELIENEHEHLVTLRKAGYSEATIRQIQKSNTSILLEEMRMECVDRALRQETNTRMETNAHGERLLTAYAPLEIADVQWAILSVMQEEEASMRINDLKHSNEMRNA